MLKMCPYGPHAGTQFVNRVYLSRGWLEFVKENGFQVGDRIIFQMVKMSTFRVIVCSQLQRNVVFQNAGISPKDEEESGHDSNRTIENVVNSSEAPLYSKVSHRCVKQETAVPKCETNFNPAESPAPQWHRGPPDTVKVEAVKMSPTLRVEDFVKHPGLTSAISLGSRFPQFVRKLTTASVEGGRDIRLVSLISCCR